MAPELGGRDAPHLIAGFIRARGLANACLADAVRSRPRLPLDGSACGLIHPTRA